MNWEEALKEIKPLVSKEGYLQAKAYLTSRKTSMQGIWPFRQEKETKFTLAPTFTGEGIIIEAKGYDDVFIY